MVASEPATALLGAVVEENKALVSGPNEWEKGVALLEKLAKADTQLLEDVARVQENTPRADTLVIMIVRRLRGLSLSSWACFWLTGRGSLMAGDTCSLRLRLSTLILTNPNMKSACWVPFLFLSLSLFQDSESIYVFLNIRVE
jgi:hypothetical protein